VKRLFELEVPELVDGVVELRAVAREPGHRTKIAVASNDNNVDPVGACVGARGMRVRQVVNELRGEKVDIVPFSDDPAEFVMKALAPAKVREVRIHDETGIAEVIVPDFQLSLAIGKEGQNARLAARLTGWRVDIKSETQLAEEEAGGGEGEDYAEGEWFTNDAGELMFQPAGGGEAISAAEAGYATLEVGANPDDVPDSEGVTDAIPSGGDETVVPAAEEAALHVEADSEDVAADELASDADLAAEEVDVRAEADELIEENPGEPVEQTSGGEEGNP
jgi:N utilization substance protein A